MTCHMAQQVQEYFLLEFECCRSTFDTVNPSTYLTTDPPAPPLKQCWEIIPIGIQFYKKHTNFVLWGRGGQKKWPCTTVVKFVAGWTEFWFLFLEGGSGRETGPWKTVVKFVAGWIEFSILFCKLGRYCWADVSVTVHGGMGDGMSFLILL